MKDCDKESDVEIDTHTLWLYYLDSAARSNSSSGLQRTVHEDRLSLMYI